MASILNYRYCLLAGICAAGGSFFGKLPSFINDHQFIESESFSLFESAYLNRYFGKSENISTS